MESGGGGGGIVVRLLCLDTSGGRVPFRFVLCGEGFWGGGMERGLSDQPFCMWRGEVESSVVRYFSFGEGWWEGWWEGPGGGGGGDNNWACLVWRGEGGRVVIKLVMCEKGRVGVGEGGGSDQTCLM